MTGCTDNMATLFRRARITPAGEMLIALIRSAIWRTPVDPSLFEAADSETWKQIVKLSVKQGVMALALDGALTLPQELQPPRAIKLGWAINTENVERRFARHEEVAAEITGMLLSSGIKVLMLKGASVARHFPIPSHRESGDIDIYTFDDWNEAEAVLKDNGATWIEHEVENEKHSAMMYKGVMIENHRSFLDIIDPRDAILEERLQKSARDNDPVPGIGMPYPPVDFDALFLMCHALHHFVTGGIVLRHLCDWTMFLSANEGKMDMRSYRDALGSVGHLKLADAFTSLSVTALGLSDSAAGNFNRDNNLDAKVLADIFNPYEANAGNFKEVMKFKYRRLMLRRWKYEMLYPGQFRKEIWRSVVLHIKNPKLINK